MAEHTPTPWEIRHRLNSIGAPNKGGRWVIAQTGTSKREDYFIAEMPFAACRSADEREHDANAAFIVKAANAHDAMIALLVRWMNDEAPIDERASVVEDTRAFLASVGTSGSGS